MIARKIRHNLAKLASCITTNYHRFMGIKIGKGGRISIHAHLDTRRGKIVIGNNVSIAGGTFILSHTGFQPTKEGEKTIIEDNVKVFVNSVILPGVKIGTNSIIGAGSVVMKDVPPNVVVMGNPARVIQHLENKE